MRQITIIGIPDQHPVFSTEIETLISETRLFAGGKRHLQLVESFLPENREWVSIIAPLMSLFKRIDETKGDWIVFASGDPFFFGIGNTLKREFPNAKITVSPAFNSLQTLAHRFGLAYGEFQTISLTGRDRHEFNKALIRGIPKMGILTDRKNTPAFIAQQMLDYNYTNYKMFYGEHLGGEKERVVELTLEEAIAFDFNHPNCFYLEKTDEKIPQKGIPENKFEPLEGRPNMITKMPIRITTLSLMQLESKNIFWDIGACTGSISIETRLNYPHLKVTAFEIRSESEGIIKRNAKKFQTPGIQYFGGDFLKQDKTKLEKPDAVFMGGYGGKMDDVLNNVHLQLTENGVIAFNSVSEKSKDAFVRWCKKKTYTIQHKMALTVDQHNTVTILVAKIKRTGA